MTDANTPLGRVWTDADFEAAVLEQSQQMPVLVDFMATWCHPCRLMEPALHALVEERQGLLHLVQIDIDANPYLAQAWGVSGVPAVFLFYRKKLLGHFTGLASKEQLHSFLDRLLPSPLDEKIEQARAMLPDHPQEALALLQPEMAAHPENEELMAVMAAIYLEQGDLKAARKAAAEVTEASGYFPLAKEVQARIGWLEAVQKRGGVAACQQEWQQHPERADALLGWGLALASNKQFEAALPILLQAGRTDPQLAKGPVKEAMVSLFQILGPENESANEHRGQLASLLY